MHDDIRNRLAAVIARQFNADPASITASTTAYDVDGWDSLSHVYLIMVLEDEFGVRLPPERVVDLADVGALAALIETQIAASG